MQTNIFKAALFDLDGTLFDTEPQYTIFWGRTARRYRPDVPNLEYAIKGTTLTQIFANYFPDPQVQAEITEALNDWEGTMRYEFVPGALDFLHDIKAHGVKCAVVTSSNMVKMKSVARQIPEFHSLFDRILTAEDFTASKPDPQCYRLGAEVFGLKPEDCVVFEDAFTGLAAGMASGAYTIGMATGNPADSIRHLCHTVWTDWHDRTYGEVADLLSQVAP